MAPLNLKRLLGSGHETMVFLDLREARQAQQERAAAKAEELRVLAVKEAIQPSIFSLTSGDDDTDYQFRRITSPQTLRDLNPLMHDRMQQVCFFLAVTTPFGKRIVEIITSYVVGERFKVICEDPKAQEVIDKFWDDDINCMGTRCQSMCNELTTFGEFCTPVSVNPVDGFVRLGYIDPMQIESIQYGKMNIGGGDQIVAFPVNVVLRKEVGIPEQRVLSIIRREEDITSPSWGYLSGETFYFAINKAMSASRGISELFSLADWIDVFDQMIFDFADKVRFLNSYVWHYTLTGADQKQTDAYSKEITQNPPRQGTVFVSNEKVSVDAKTPDFKGADMSAGAEMVKKYGIGGAGLPDWFFGDSGSGNRSTAAEMQGPTGKKLTMRQQHQVDCIKRLTGFVLEQAQLHGALGKNVNLAHTIEVPELLVRDLSGAANVLTGATQAVAEAEDRGWVQGETAARIFHMLIGQLGTEIDDSKAEYEAAQQQLEDKQANQQDSLFAQNALAKAIAQQQPGAPDPPVGPDGKPKPATAEQADGMVKEAAVWDGDARFAAWWRDYVENTGSTPTFAETIAAAAEARKAMLKVA
jgi:hypothetical protein